MFARFDENPAMTLQDIKKTKRYGRMDGRTDARMHGQCENSIPTTNKFAGGINTLLLPCVECLPVDPATWVHSQLGQVKIFALRHRQR